MAILLDSSGRVVLNNGSARYGSSGDGCCCYIEATPCTSGSPRVWVSTSAIVPLSGDSRMWFRYPSGAFYSVAVTDPASTPVGARVLTTTPTDRRRGCPAITAYRTMEDTHTVGGCVRDRRWFYAGDEAYAYLSGSPPANRINGVASACTDSDRGTADFDYTTTVNLNAYVDLAQVQLQASADGDNGIRSVTINGTVWTAPSSWLPGATGGATNGGVKIFTRSDGLIIGDNTFVFKVGNTGGPEGLRVTWSVVML